MTELNTSFEQQSSYNHEEVLKLSEGKIFGDSAPKLPMPNMLMVDRITQITADGGAHGRGFIEAELDIKPEQWFFGCHFKNDPVMPGCLGLDAMWQLTGLFLGWSGHLGKGRALSVKRVKFTGQVLPENKMITYRIDIRRIIARKLVLAISDGTVLVDGEKIYSADDLQVGLFTD